MTRYIKCRYCDWQTSLYNKGSRAMTGWRRLSNHVYDYHPEQAEALEQHLSETYGDILDDIDDPEREIAPGIKRPDPAWHPDRSMYA